MKKHKSIVSQKQKNIIKKKYFGEIKIDNVSAIQKLYEIFKKNKTEEICAKNKISSNNIQMENDPDFEKITFAGKKWKTPFYKKKHEAGCNKKECSCLKPVRLLERYLNENEILIHSKYKGDYLFSKINRDNFNELLTKNRSIYETIYSEYPRRLYIDVDGTNSECLTKAKEVLYKVFPKDIKMSISGSVGEKRGKAFYSYHIVLPNIVFKNLEQMKTSGFHEFIKSQANEINGIDKNVYGNTQQFKAINQSKYKSNRIQNVIENNNHEEHIIQVFDTKPNAMNYKSEFTKHIKFEIKKTNLKAYKQGKKCGITGFTLEDIIPLKDVKLPNIDFEFDSAIKILEHIPNRKGQHKLGRTIMWCIMNWFYHEEGNSETAFKIFQEWEKPHERNSPQSYQSWVDCEKSQRWWGRQKIQHLLEKIYGSALPNPRLDTFNRQFIKGEITDITNTKCNTKYLRQEDIGKEKYCCMKLGMGKGKTYTTIEWLINECNKNPKLKICWVTNRISMALNLMDRLNGNNDTKLKGKGRNLKFKNYKEVGISGFGGKAQTSNKRHMIRNEVGRIVIELESIHYSSADGYNNEAGMDYDIVVIDEIESVFNSFRSDKTHGAGRFYDTNYHRFEEIMINAKKVFLMDAYFHHRTIDYIKILEPQASINLIQSDDDKIDKVIHNHQSFYSWYNKIVDDINKNKKLYIFYPFKTGKGSVQKLSIDGLKQRLLHNCPNLEYDKVLVYQGDMSDKAKKELEKVNDIWKEARVIITNSCITVGVNYEYDDFDKVYLSYADILNPRDVIQSSFRIRKTKEDIIEFYRFPNLFKILATQKGIMYEPTPINKPKLLENTDSFIFMRNFLLEEYNAKGHETLKRFFKETGYIINNKWVGGDSNPIQYKSFDGEGSLGIWEWANIKSISTEEKERKESKIFDNTATIDDKLEVRKWYNDIAFKDFSYDDEDKSWNKNNTDAIKEAFYKKPKYLEGFKAIWDNEEDGVMKYVISYEDDKYKYNNNPLSIEDKECIERYLHLSDLHEIGKKHYNGFMDMSDYKIKKKILIHYFGINIMKKKEEWENRKIGEFDADFNEFCDLTKTYAKKITPYNEKELFTKLVMEELKDRFNPTKLNGYCWLDDDED